MKPSHDVVWTKEDVQIAMEDLALTNFGMSAEEALDAFFAGGLPDTLAMEHLRTLAYMLRYARPKP